MSNQRIRSDVGLALLVPASASAHALSPAYYPVGHIPILVGLEWWPAFALIPTAIAASALALRWRIPALGIGAHAWRAAVLYVVTQSAQLAAIFLLESLFRTAGWSSSVVENLGPLSLLLVCALAAAMIAVWFLYRRAEPRLGRLALSVCLAPAASYGAALACTWLMVAFH